VTHTYYVTEGIDESACVTEARRREEPATVHHHRYGEPCNGHGCYQVIPKDGQ
jgi:hypothetical protein